MLFARTSSWLPLVCLLTLAAAVLGGLMLGVAGDRKDMHALPNPTATVDVLGDPLANFGFAEVRTKPLSAWASWSGLGYIQALTGEAVWVRVTLRNPGAQPLRGVLADAEYNTDRLDLWTPDAQVDGGWTHRRAGEWVPAAEKALWGRDAAFFVEVPARGETVVYLRVEDHFGVWLRPVWWPEERSFFSAQLRDTVAESAYFGVLLALFVYNGVVWARLRFRDLGYYLGYLLSIATFMFFVRAQHPLIGWAAGSPFTEVPVTFCIGASGFFLAQFGRVFLELGVRVPWADRVAKIAGAVMGLLAVGGLAFPWMNNTIWLHFAVVGGTVTHATLLVAAIAAWRAGSYHARYFVLSFGLFLAGMLPTAMIWLLAIPVGVSAMSMMLGSALEMLLLSLAIADRFARLQHEKLAAQQRATEEAEQRRAIQEAYADELEHEVRARTQELVAANADKDRMMAVLGHDLRSPLTSLTLAAEQAGTVAHANPRAFAVDAAQTGRALLLLLEDVVLWARLRAGGGKAAEHAATAIVGPPVELHRRMAERRDVALDTLVDPGLRVRVDLVLTQTLVRNLISNAVKLARTRVVVAVARDERALGRLRIAVRDDGPGLPPMVKAMLREPRPTESNSLWAGRGGLGLRLCVEIARAMGTTLEAHDATGGGAELWFTVPVGVDPVPEVKPSSVACAEPVTD